MASFTLSVSNVTPTHASLSWTAPAGTPVAQYQVFRDGSSVHTQDGTDRDWGDDGLSQGTAYAFKVYAYNPPGTIVGVSTTVNIVTPSPPAAPSLLTAQAISTTQINLDWQDNSSDELDFHIETSANGSTGWAEISPATVAANVTHKEVTGLASDTLAYYRVRSHNASGYSGYSNVAYARTFAAVAQPTNLTATPYSGTEVDLSFQDNSTAEDDHRLERKEGAGAYSEVKTISANVTGCRDTGLTAGHTYVYRVRAKAGAAYSDYSNEVTVTTISVPGAPSAIVISEVQDTTVRLTWTAPATGGAVVGYKIESSPDDSTWTERAKIYTQVCSYKPISLTASTLVYFRARAFNAAGDGSYSASASTTTLAAYAPSVFEKWLRNPVGRSVVLIEAHPKLTLQGWTLYGATYTYQVTINIDRAPVDEVLENGVALTEAASIAAVETTAGSWYFDFWNRVLYVHTSDGSTPTNFHMEAGVWLYVTNAQDGTITFNDRNYLNFLTADGVSAFSQELKALHEGSFAASSGSITFINAMQANGEHFFDKLHGELTWINRPIRVLLGGPDFTYADFRAVFTGLVARHVCNDENFSVDLVDPREGIHRDLPVNHFWPSEYPSIADADSMKEVPVLYGAITGATPTKIGTNIYKYHDGRCKGITAVRINDVTQTAGTHYSDDPAQGILTFVSTLTIADGDIIAADFEGRMSDDNVSLTNGALIFKDVMNEFLNLTDADLDLDTIWETKAAKTAVLAAPFFVTRDSQRFIRDLEVSLGAFTSQDAEGRIGLKALTTTAPSSAVRIADHQLFGLESEKSRDALSYSAVEILYAQDPQAQTWERVQRTSVVLAAKYGAVKTLSLETYLTTSADAIAVGDAILAGLEAEQVSFPAGSIAFGVMPGDLIVYTRGRYFDAQGTAVEKTLRVLKADKNVATRQTSIGAEGV